MSLIEKDYIVRLIYEVIRTLLRMIFRIDIAKKNGFQFEEEQRQQFYEELTKLVEAGEINDAENKLLTGLNVYEPLDLQLALLFYGYLNEKDNDYLEIHGFSRKEIAEGIQMVCSLFGYGTMAQSLLEDLELEE